jgi:cell fate (sporulation/competence/biofilm development) regulator YlbF (YheA/YmcA/DUF963 family)
MRERNEISALKERYAKLAAQLCATDLILQGTITERTIKKKKESGVHSDAKTLGPYYQWTFKREGKTVTINLSKAQTKRFQKAIDANKKAEAILKQMRELSREILEASTQGVARRK